MSWAESQQVIPVQVEQYFAQVGNTVKVRPPRQSVGWIAASQVPARCGFVRSI